MRSTMGFAGQHKAPDAVAIFNLAGPVEEVRHTETPILGGKHMLTVTCFKPDGNRIDHTVFGPGGVFVSRYVYGYDEMGLRTGPTFYKGAPDCLDHRVVFDYGAEGRRLSQEQYDAAGVLEFRVLFTYNEMGLRDCVQWRRPDGSVIRTYQLQYDSLGRKAFLQSLGPAGQREWKVRYAYTGRNEFWLSCGQRTVNFWLHLAHDGFGNWTRALRLSIGYWPRLRFIPVPFLRLARVDRTIRMRGEEQQNAEAQAADIRGGQQDHATAPTHER